MSLNYEAFIGLVILSCRHRILGPSFQPVTSATNASALFIWPLRAWFQKEDHTHERVAAPMVKHAMIHIKEC